ncbi:MAG: DNA methyltransferase [Limnochordia bacterium]
MEHTKLPLEMPETKKNDGPVTCLGMTFENNEERRAYFTEILREKLPELKQIEGYPIGEDEDILALSDPPYYTACPNPFLGEFIKYHGRPYDSSEQYHREPYASDVSEGRYAPESLAHSYHTKVPARAIIRYILHYTNPGDVVLDGFGGSGMTAVAAQLCAQMSEEERQAIQKDVGDAKWGLRYSVISDLAPAATFIAANYLRVPAINDLEARCKKVIEAVRAETDWMYVTNEGQKHRIMHTVWSDVFTCHNCTEEVVFWSAASDAEGTKIRDEFPCPSCGVTLTKRSMQRAWISNFDNILNKTVSYQKQVPVSISYRVAGKTIHKDPDNKDLELLRKIEEFDFCYWVPSYVVPDGDKTSEPLRVGLDHINMFYTDRNLYSLAVLRKHVFEPNVSWGSSMLLTATAQKCSKMMRYMSDGIGRIQNGVLYFPSLFKESNPSHLMEIAMKQIMKLNSAMLSDPSTTMISTSSASDLGSLPDDSIDYIFTDPPFGGNIMYSELNLVWESWLKVRTNNEMEAIENRSQRKAVFEYQKLMERCFVEYYRVLKPGRWMTIVFHNSRNSIWNAIQEALQLAGFVVADVRTLDKKQGSYNQVTGMGAVKQDLTISVYKPIRELDKRFELEPGTSETMWKFVHLHLRQLPCFVFVDEKLEVIAERQNYMLYDRMVAFHVQRGVTVPMSAAEFYQGLEQRFPRRDGMYFLPDQAIEYDKKRIKVTEIRGLRLFVSDEASAIQWLKQLITSKPQTFQQLHPRFMKELGGWQKHEKPLELLELLEQNFLMYDGTGPVPSQIHSYLSTDFKDMRNLEKEDPKLQAKAKNRWYVPDPNKQADLDKLRERFLLREFDGYLEELSKSKKKLRQFRTEAVRAGFKTAWGNKDYQTIVDVGQRLPEKILQEDSTMLMYYDNAQIRLGM